MKQCKMCKKCFDTNSWTEHAKEKAVCSAEGFEQRATILFCDKNSDKFDVDEKTMRSSNAKAKNFLYLADNQAKVLYPKYVIQ